MKAHVTALAASAILGLTAVQSQARDLVFGSFVPPKHIINVLGLEPMFENLKGTVDWELVAGGQLFSGGTSLKGVGGGIADAGIVVSAFTRSELKNSFVIADMLMLGDDALVMNGAALEAQMIECTDCIEDFDKAKTKFLSGYAFDGYSLMCRGDAITSVDDIKGLKLRTTGAGGRWAKALGGTPVSIGSGEMAEALQRGQIDCAMGPVAWLKSYPIEDAVKSIYYYDLGSLGGIGAFVMNSRAWSSLSAEQRAAMWAELPGLSARMTIVGYERDKLAALEYAKGLGIEITNGGDDVREIWAQHTQNERATIVEGGQALGSKDPQQVLDIMTVKLEKWQKLIDESGLRQMIDNGDGSNLSEISDKYEALLKAEIFDKIDPEKY